MKMLKLLQEMRGLSEFGRSQPAPKPSPLYLMQLRARLAEKQRPKRRLVIQVDLQDVATIPTSVKITHIAPQPSANASMR